MSTLAAALLLLAILALAIKYLLLPTFVLLLFCWLLWRVVRRTVFKLLALFLEILVFVMRGFRIPPPAEYTCRHPAPK
jgi:hypothetical protein